MERDHARLHLLSGERDGDLASGEGLLDDALLDPLCVLRRDGASLERVVVGERRAPVGLALREPIFEVCDARTAQREHLSGAPQVEQAVAQREVEELPLPPLDAPGRGGRRLVGDLAWQASEVGSRGQGGGARRPVPARARGRVLHRARGERADARGARARAMSTAVTNSGVPALVETASALIGRCVEPHGGDAGRAAWSRWGRARGLGPPCARRPGRAR